MMATITAPLAKEAVAPLVPAGFQMRYLVTAWIDPAVFDDPPALADLYADIEEQLTEMGGGPVRIGPVRISEMRARQMIKRHDLWSAVLMCWPHPGAEIIVRGAAIPEGSE